MGGLRWAARFHRVMWQPYTGWPGEVTRAHQVKKGSIQEEAQCQV